MTTIMLVVIKVVVLVIIIFIVIILIFMIFSSSSPGFSGSRHTSDFKIGTPVATLPLAL